MKPDSVVAHGGSVVALGDSLVAHGDSVVAHDSLQYSSQRTLSIFSKSSLR